MKYLLLLVAFSANAQTTIYSNQYGQPIGSSITINGTTYISNQYGQPVATATQPVATLPPAPIVPPALPTLPLMPPLQPLPMLGK